ncbi:MAG: hypothetical protein FWK01_10245 [Pantanalinema sp. GBBB05]|nr:hypothetical protein [Pantanalinema sp. GBBB05]
MDSRQELIALISRLLEENDAAEWENETAHRFLEALAAWLNDADGFYRNIKEARDPNEASWQLFADALQAATVYE